MVQLTKKTKKQTQKTPLTQAGWLLKFRTIDWKLLQMQHSVHFFWILRIHLINVEKEDAYLSNHSKTLDDQRCWDGLNTFSSYL